MPPKSLVSSSFLISFEVKTLTDISFSLEMKDDLSFNEVVNLIVPHVKCIQPYNYQFSKMSWYNSLEPDEYIPEPDAHRYIYKGHQIDSNLWDSSLKDLGIVEGCRIHLVMRFCGD